MEGCSLQGNEARRVGGSNAGLAVLDGLVADGELCKVVANHVVLDLHLVEGLAIVDADDAADHLGHDDHVPQVCPHWLGLLALLSLLLGLPQLLDQRQRLTLEPALESAHTSPISIHFNLLTRPGMPWQHDCGICVMYRDDVQ